MGLAEIRALREGQFEQPMSEIAGAKDILAALAEEAVAEVAVQGIAPDAIRTEYRAFLRHKGSHQALELDFGTEADLRDRFKVAHKARYGFDGGDRELIFEA